MADLKVLNSGQQQFKETSCQVMGNLQVRVYIHHFTDEGFNHLSFALEELQVLPILNLLVKIEWHRLSVEFSQHCHCRELLLK